jgi:phosphohistidine swiveling domain-containing protein
MKKEIIEELLNKDWYYQGFNATPILIDGPIQSMLFDMYDILGFGYNGAIRFFENDVGYYLYNFRDLEKIKGQLIKKYSEDKEYLTWLSQTDKKNCIESLQKIQDLFSAKQLSKYSINDLYELWRDMNKFYSKMLGISHAVEGFTLTTEDTIRKGISNAFSSDENALSVLTSPPSHSFITEEHYSLALIAQKCIEFGESSCNESMLEKYPDIRLDIQQHTDAYFWKLNNYTGAQVTTYEQFIGEINDMLTDPDTIKKVIKNFESLSKKIEERDAYMQKIEDHELRVLLEINYVIFEIHDRRKGYMIHCITYLDEVLREIAKRHALPVSHLRYILPYEFEQLPELAEELTQRRKASVYFATKDEHVAMSGQEASNYIERLKRKHEFVGDVLHGNVASKGQVTAKVKVCRGIEEIAKIKKGDILVACMTQPEFLPAIKKASAIITDEGGLTCHAAIIARELGIPCVIGTKIATKVLKDGMTAHVDADKGTIHILEK